MDESPIKIDPEIMHGEPCFRGTRVPVKTLFDYLAGGESIDRFLEGFPTVSRELVISVLHQAQERIVQPAQPAA
ncbi:MAG: DUF433 domain-containing protein [Planctomycetota bacterium]